jgi:hypothetical protein
MTVFNGWENFYVIVGSSAGALIGLQFVVVTLIAETPIVRDMERAGSAFGTPTIIHFGSVLLLSALSAPRGTASPAPQFSGGCSDWLGWYTWSSWPDGMRVQTAYSPVFEDRLFHIALPFAAYGTLAGSAYAARSNVGGALFGVGAAALLLLFIGIHNAWDAVTYHVFVTRREQQVTERRR